MKTKQYTVMVETKEIRKICVVANSAEEAAEFICKVVANTDILHTDLSEDSEVITQVAAYGKDEKDTAKCQMFRVGVPCVAAPHHLLLNLLRQCTPKMQLFQLEQIINMGTRPYYAYFEKFFYIKMTADFVFVSGLNRLNKRFLLYQLSS